MDQTVGTFSWMQGNLHPSYALATVYQPDPVLCSPPPRTSGPTGGGASGVTSGREEHQLGETEHAALCTPYVEVHVCSLMPLELLYRVYALLGFATVLALVLIPDSTMRVMRTGYLPSRVHLTASALFSSPSSYRSALLPRFVPSSALPPPQRQQQQPQPRECSSVLLPCEPSPHQHHPLQQLPKEEEVMVEECKPTPTSCEECNHLPAPLHRITDVVRFVAILLPVYLVMEAFKRY
jgi:hypothetical protein